MNENIKKQILDKIESYQTIIVSRHIRPDGDAIGSTKGFTKILRDSFPDKKIYLVNDDYSDYLAFLGGEDSVSDEVYDGALLIVIDTGTEDRISNKNYKKAKEIIKIDHHIDDKPYGDISWVEDFRSSACEMIADFCLTFRDRLKMSSEAATYIYLGMVTDSGRFRYDGVTGETMRIAGALLDMGVNTEKLFAELYVDDIETLKLKSYVYDNIKITKNGVAYVYMSEKVQKKFNLTLEAASDVVSELSAIRGSLIWIAFIDNKAKNSIRVRLRSRFLGVNELANNYHGGGHKMAAGATVYSEKEMNTLIEDADRLLGEYKATHGGWL